MNVLAYGTTDKLVKQQSRFWSGYDEMDGVVYVGPTAIPMNKIFIDDEFPEPESILKYQKAMDAGKAFPPILVVPPLRKGGRFRVVDGKHRFTAAKMNGATHILVLVETFDEARKGI